MSQKVLLISLVLFGLVFSGMTGECFADTLSERLVASDEIYRDIRIRQSVNKNRYEQGVADYEGIVTNYPNTDRAFKAQMKLATLHIARGKWIRADAAYQKLIADFSGNENMAEAVRDIAYHYYTAGKHDKASELYQHVVGNWPQSYCGKWSKLGLAISDIALGKEQAGQAKIDQLLTEFSGDESMTRAVRDIAYLFRTEGKYQKANQLYQYVITNWPENEYALWSRMGLAESHISAGNETSAKTEIEGLISSFKGHPKLPAALYDIARRYEMERNSKEAQNMYRLIMWEHPNSYEADKSQSDVQRLNILDLVGWKEGQNDRVAIDNLIANFSNHPGFPGAICWIEESYFNKILAAIAADEPVPLDRSYYERPIQIWEQVIGECPDFYWAEADFYYFIGYCYYFLGEYEKAIKYCRKVVSTWPDYAYLDRANLIIEDCLQKL